MHVHDESFSAGRQPLPPRGDRPQGDLRRQEMSLEPRVRLAAVNILGDYREAPRVGCLKDNLVDIPRFRTAQFFGTYRGFPQSGPVPEALQAPLLLPARRTGGVPESTRETEPGRLIDYDDPAPRRERGVAGHLAGARARICRSGPEAPAYRRHRGCRSRAGDDANVSQLDDGRAHAAPTWTPRSISSTAAPPWRISGSTAFVGPARRRRRRRRRGDRRRGARRAADLPDGVERLLLRTANSPEPDLYQAPFDEDYAALTLDGAEWLVAATERPPDRDRLPLRAASCADPPTSIASSSAPESRSSRALDLHAVDAGRLRARLPAHSVWPASRPPRASHPATQRRPPDAAHRRLRPDAPRQRARRRARTTARSAAGRSFTTSSARCWPARRSTRS